MRIIAGKNRGRTIQAPSGSSTRPTVDRVRESMMSAIYSSLGGFEGAKVLDLFAGSGALGLEALSRGCEFCLFNDTDASARKCIEGNLSVLGYESPKARVASIDALHGGIVPSNDAFDLVFLDPPYDTPQDAVFEMVREMAASGTIDEEALVVYEHDEPVNAEALSASGLMLSKEKKYGKTFVSYLRLH